MNLEELKAVPMMALVEELMNRENVFAMSCRHEQSHYHVSVTNKDHGIDMTSDAQGGGKTHILIVKL